jgi:hypothetical protein
LKDCGCCCHLPLLKTACTKNTEFICQSFCNNKNVLWYDLQVLECRGDLLGEATCHFLLGEAYSRICRPGRAHAAFSACRRLREQVASSTGARDNGGIANALCREGVAAYLCGEFPAATQALVALVTNYAPVQAHWDITFAASATAYEVVDANKTLGLTQVFLSYSGLDVFIVNFVGTACSGQRCRRSRSFRTSLSAGIASKQQNTRSKGNSCIWRNV